MFIYQVSTNPSGRELVAGRGTKMAMQSPHRPFQCGVLARMGPKISMRQHRLPTLPNFAYKISGQPTILQPDGALHLDQESALQQSQHPTTASMFF